MSLRNSEKNTERMIDRSNREENASKILFEESRIPVRVFTYLIYANDYSDIDGSKIKTSAFSKTKRGKIYMSRQRYRLNSRRDSET